jgi:SAM-dependent methyltransferase
MRLIKKYLSPASVFLDIGAGDCVLAINVAKFVKKAYAIDVSSAITKDYKWPKNLRFILTDGLKFPIRNSSVDLAYSNQLMEHLHPDDAFAQVRGIYDALKTKGKYICITPNKLSGPHDISCHFDEIATGFHLKEYTVAELVKLFKRAGFSDIKLIIAKKNRIIFNGFPLFIIAALESALKTMPFRFRKKLARSRPIRTLLGIKIVATK